MVRISSITSGSQLLRTIRQSFSHYQSDRRLTEKRVAILRLLAAPYHPPEVHVRAKASRISAEQKVRNLSYLGFEVNHVVLPHDISQASFADRIEDFNTDPNTLGIIVQMPVPEKFNGLIRLIKPEKDIDALLGDESPYPACATAEGIVRVVRPFTADDPTIALVGSKGFVGKGVARLLKADGITPIELDMGDDLTRIHEADIVVSSTGRPRLLGRQHLRPYHRLVVDSGFVPQADGRILSDVRREAFDIPQNITPVPGGIGPVEMAVLMERALERAPGVSVSSWQYGGRPYKSREALAESPRRPLALHAVLAAQRAKRAGGQGIGGALQGLSIVAPSFQGAMIGSMPAVDLARRTDPRLPEASRTHRKASLALQRTRALSR
ncbi:MAG TPA: bifunctional 5,10-methylenetetrahydrofolate dehydrogenase/5,10-methenyltetrahydrofolate cyclohydrolase [Mycobacteriales bacterium]|jgi:methylenetetrahydrofolate dehydrogenase (NADP+)/methenyltetrahydrofolate cyclohydrolase|nr:bifunctional 5,10-methylenetetrahydrofolate dehydrogenase/5,10-methenyltetrahydrofolate cyclohydrolase [Mycobacteriales bacterium]